MTDSQDKPDWSAQQYLKFSSERTRAVYDLITQVAPHIHTPSPRVFDLGCGPGNSTQVLLSAFPHAKVTGMDSSPDMLRKAQSTLPDVEFVNGDLERYTPNEAPDLLFGNAVFHWLRHSARIPTLVRLFAALKPGGVLAIQVPDNYHAPSHSLMRATATQPNTAWSPYFAETSVGELADTTRPDLDPIEPPTAFYNALVPSAQSVNIWRTEYFHVLPDAHAIVEWVRGTGLQPYVNRITDEAAREEFLAEYERRLKEAYPALQDGKVMLAYPRLFIVARKHICDPKVAGTQ